MNNVRRSSIYSFAKNAYAPSWRSREKGDFDIRNVISKIENSYELASLMFCSEREYKSKLRIICKHIFDFTKGSLDLPLASSIAAHSFVFSDLLNYSRQLDAIEFYKKKISKATLIGCLANSEYGAGCDLKKIKARISIENHVKLEKPCITNGSISNLGVFSIKDHNEKLQIYLLNITEKERFDINQDMNFFQSGSTGKILIDRSIQKQREYRLSQTNQHAFQLLRRCFDTERLILSVMAAGLLEGIEELLTEQILMHKTLQTNVLKYQLLQQKITNIIQNKNVLNSLIYTIIEKADYHFNNVQEELSTAKIYSLEKGFSSAVESLELLGSSALLNSHIVQKITRDIFAYRFFGGTKELHANMLFHQFHSKVLQKQCNTSKAA